MFIPLSILCRNMAEYIVYMVFTCVVGTTVFYGDMYMQLYISI